MTIALFGFAYVAISLALYLWASLKISLDGKTVNFGKLSYIFKMFWVMGVSK